MKQLFLPIVLAFIMGCESNDNPIDVTKSVPTELTLKGNFEGQTLSLSSKKMVVFNGSRVPEVVATVIKRRAGDPETLSILGYLEGSRSFAFNYILKPENPLGEYTGFSGVGTMTTGQVLNTIIDLTNTRLYNTFNSANNKGRIEIFDRVYRNLKVTNFGTAQRVTSGDTLSASVSYSFTAEGLVAIP